LKKRIVFLITGLAYGGAENQLKSLAVKLKARNWDVGVISLLPPIAHVKEMEDSGICVSNLGMKRKRPDPRAILRLARILREWQPQILHSHMVHANLLARVTRMLVRVPVLVCTAHSINEGGRWREIAYRLTDNLCDITTNVSNVAVSRYIEVGAVPSNKIKFIPNGIDSLEYQRVSDDYRRQLRKKFELDGFFAWLAVGRLEAVKDYVTMIRAFDIVRRKYKNTVLFIAGEGPIRSDIQKFIYELELADKVHLLGLRKDIKDLMNAADGFVSSSIYEGLSMVLLEASACGLPIVATNVGGNKEIVLDGKSGYLVPVGEYELLAETMLQLMLLPIEDRICMGNIARNHVMKNYDIESVVDQWESLYNELLAKKIV